MKKRILIFIDWFLPGYKAGGPISSNANLVDHLKDEFEFYIITRDTDYCETKPYPGLNSDTWNVLPNGANVYYVSAPKLGIKNLIKICKTIDFDLVYVNGIYSLYFSLFPLVYFKYFTKKKVVVAGRGMISDHTFSSKKGKKKIFYSFAKYIQLYKGITFHATNGEEANQIRKNVGFNGTVKVAPNLPPKHITTVKRNGTKKPGELRLVSIARISPEKNTLFALQVLEASLLLSPFCLLTFDLYGTIYNQSYWNECLEVIQRFPSNIKVNFCGPLEKEKIQSMLKEYHFLFMPSQGENYGHAIVESFMAGCPVIISDRTPWKNLQNCQLSIINYQLPVGWDIPLDEPERFAEVIQYCARMDQDEYDTLSLRALEYAGQIASDNAILEANKKLFV